MQRKMKIKRVNFSKPTLIGGEVSEGFPTKKDHAIKREECSIEREKDGVLFIINAPLKQETRLVPFSNIASVEFDYEPETKIKKS